MSDGNTTIQAIEIATNKLNWYIFFSILSSIISIIAVIISTRNNRKSLETINKNHTEQLKASHDWNRRSFSVTYLNGVIEKIQDTRKELNKLTSKIAIGGDKSNKMSFSDRFLRGNALTEEEVHDWICEWDIEKKAFVKEKADGDSFKLTENGDKIRIHLITLINIYETVGSAIKNRILDEDVLQSLMRGPISANYIFFEQWIKHLRNKHGLKNAGKNFEELYRIVNPPQKIEQRAKTEDV